ncbi:hypothetical protein CXF86_11065 [Shewanella sp. GutCb]|uniref:hypothetical protein n=1 Tax=Shewanella sp. GutCb TaxID=2058315 RepID=UPI000C7E2CE9|nr:hypothetical protein [Shewanella sp. GutCb]PKG74822.1 hypothetical protein CXF86_11065 [Shewanella sp. GutCb]
MNTVTKPLVCQSAHAANEHITSDGHVNAIFALRQMMGKSSAASRFDKLPAQQRAMILLTARLKPSEYINQPLLSMSPSDCDAVRLAIIGLVDLAKTFSCVPLSRDRFVTPRKPKSVKQIGVQRNAIEDELSRDLKDINALAAELALEVESISNVQ